MLSLLLVSALLAGPQGDAPASKPPVFHAEAYVVTWCCIKFYDRAHGHSSGLTSDNFQAFVNNMPVAVNVSEDPKEPGSYILGINPPVELRDCKSHRIDVKIRHWPKPDDDWHDLNVKWTAVFKKPHVGL